MIVLARALPLGNGHSLRTKILRSLLVKFPTFQVVWVYTYFIGEEVDFFDSIPSDLETLIIPAQKYIKFTNGPGSMPDVVRKPWQQIWQMTPEELGGIRS